jgi:hypothetical protein
MKMDSIDIIDDFLLSNSSYTPTNYTKIITILIISSVLILIVIYVVYNRKNRNKK